VSAGDAVVGVPTATEAPRPPRPHLWEVDVVRILTFLCVIAVHTTSHTAGPNDLPLYVLLGLLHFTRNVFFALTAFVLVYSYLHKPVPMRRFWPRRFLLVGVPYVAWSLIYFVASNLHSPGHRDFGQLTLAFLGHLFTGTAWYHLYFLLVTMQVYLLVPVILWLVAKTRGHHAAVLVIAGIVQLVIVGLYFYFPSSVAFLHGYTKEYFFSYLFFIIAGAVGADHSAGFLAWVRAHRPLIGWITLATGVVTIGVFIAAIAVGKTYSAAGTPLQPILMVWGGAVALAFLAIGTWWADRRRPDGFGTRFVRLASDRSFGIFLSHPLAIWILLWIGNDYFQKVIPTPWLTPVIYLMVIASAIIITEIARRTPLSLPLTGRRWAGRRKDAPPATTSAAPETTAAH